MKSTRTQFILSIVFMAIGISSFGISTAKACWKCDVAILMNLTEPQQIHVAQLANSLAAEGAAPAVRALIKDSIVAHVEAGYTPAQALDHVEQMLADLEL